MCELCETMMKLVMDRVDLYVLAMEAGKDAALNCSDLAEVGARLEWRDADGGAYPPNPLA